MYSVTLKHACSHPSELSESPILLLDLDDPRLDECGMASAGVLEPLVSVPIAGFFSQ